MNESLDECFASALTEYTRGPHYNRLLEARTEYSNLTGEIDEEDDEYESRMFSFNDWYLLHHIPTLATRTAIKDYFIKKGGDLKIIQSLMQVNYSVFEYCGENWQHQLVLKDVLHFKKIILAKKHRRLAFIKKDIFLGRTISLDGNNYLLSGVSLLPKDVKKIIIHESKKIFTIKDRNSETRFLLRIEYLKNRWKRYRHRDARSIFIFNDEDMY